MSVTCERGQLVQQIGNGRIWKLHSRSLDAYDNPRWNIVLVEAPHGADRPINDAAYVSESWLHLHCIDHSTTVEPPKGNGRQSCYIHLDMDGNVISIVVNSAVEAIAWFEENLRPEQHGCWSGWESADHTNPDLDVAMVDGQLVWVEP